MRSITGLLLMTLLAGCSQHEVKYDLGPDQALSVGSEIQLNRDVEIPPERARVFFQRGKMIPLGQLDYYNTSCDIQVRNLSSESQVVRPDTFTISQIVYGQEQVVQWGGIKLAGLGWGGGLLWNSDISIHRIVRFGLHSEQQPDVLRLTCRGAWDDFHSARYPSPVETRVALGDFVTFP